MHRRRDEWHHHRPHTWIPLRPRPRRSLRLSLLLAALLLLAGTLSSCGLPLGATASHAPAPGGSGHVQAATGQTGGLTYVAIGASDAFGVGTDDPETESWPSVLAGNLGAHAHLINLGIPGETVGAALQNELPVAEASRPDVVTVWLAVNDIADGVALDTYRAQLTTLLAGLRQTTHARVFVANVPDLTILPYFAQDDPAALSGRVQSWNAVIASVVASEGDVLVDLAGYSAALAQHPEYLASDGLHPSALGAEQLAIVFASVMHQHGIA